MTIVVARRAGVPPFSSRLVAGALLWSLLAAVGAATAQASCGDSVVEPGEQCDDGGVAAGDGCNASCQFEAGHWYPMGPEGGSALTMVVDPTDPDTAYVKSYHSVYKTTDGGAAWRRVGYDAAMAGDGVIVIDPTDTQKLYVSSLSGGVFKSTNGGATWQSTATPLAQMEGALALDPSAPATIYAGDFGLYKSTNGGGSWTNLSSNFGATQVRCLGVSADGTVYAGTDTGIRKSSDGGLTWSPANNGLSILVVRGIVPDPVDPDTIYIRSGYVFRTTDAAANWSQLSVTGEPSGVFSVAIDPADPAHLAVTGNAGVSVTTNNGGSWTSSTNGFGQTVSGFPATDYMGAVAVGSATKLYAINTRGVHRSTDGGVNWSLRATGMRALRHYDFSQSAGAGDAMYVTAFDAGVFHSSDHGRTWSARNNGLLTYASFVEQDPADSNHVYVGGSTGLFYSTDAGQNWTDAASLPTSSVDALAIDPVDGDRIYVGHTTVWTSADGGASWTEGGTETQGENVRWLDVTASGVVLAKTDVGLYMSSNNAASWTSINPPPVAYTAIEVDPGNPNLLYATTGQGVYQSTNGGGAWAAINTGLPPNQPRDLIAMAIDAARPQILVVGGQQGAFRTSTATPAWKPIASSTQPMLIRDVDIDPATADTFYVATHGGGLMRASQSCGNSVLDAGENCDDSAAVAGDGCSASCQIQECWQCSGLPSSCSPQANFTPCTDDGAFCDGTELCFVGTCGHTGNPCLGSVCPGSETCVGGLCYPSFTECGGAVECQTSCYEATDSCGGIPGAECGTMAGPCGLGSCDMGGTCHLDDTDSDTVGELCDNCPSDANTDQANTDCDSPTFLQTGGCEGPEADDHPGCCDGGDACDTCPGLADNDACDSGQAQSGLVDASGGSFSGPLGDVEVPAGAVNGPTVLTLEDAPAETPPDELTFSLADGIAATIEAKPEGTHFLAPVAITLRWDDRDADGLVDGGTCISGADDDLSCDSDGDCLSGDCTTDSSALTESSLTLKRNGQRFSAQGFGVGPFTCADHLAGACATAAASCAVAAGTGTATVAACCNPSTNSWRFETCDFSEFFVGRTAGDLILGGGSPRSDCVTEWSVRNPDNSPFLGRKGTINAVQTCTDGDVTCDGDGIVNDSCTFELSACANVEDPRVKLKGVVACPSVDFQPIDTSLQLAQWIVKKPRPDHKNPEAAANAIAVRDAIAALGGPGNATIGGNHSEVVTFTTPVAGADACTAGIDLEVSIIDGEATARGFKFQSVAADAPNGKNGLKDSDALTLVCQPAP